ncbi:MAG: DISARM system helicase DrmA [Planctomycetota bacterium]
MTTPFITSAPRDHLVNALEADLVGPFSPDPDAHATSDEVLQVPPSRWYVTGYLAPCGDQDPEDPTADEEMGSGSDEEEDESAGNEPEPKAKRRFPSSMGMSLLLPAPDGVEAVAATVAWADYVPEVRVLDEGKRGRTVWRRVPRDPITVNVPIDAHVIEAGVDVPGGGGLVMKGRLRPADAPGLAQGTRALALFLVNQRVPGEKSQRDAQFAFQVRLDVEYQRGFVARSNRRDEGGPDWDDRVADLHYRDRTEYAVGHGVSVEVPPQDGPVRRVRTAWLPRAEVRPLRHRQQPGVVVAMEALAGLEDAASVRQALAGLPAAYVEWIAAQRAIEPGTEPRRRVRDVLLGQAEEAARRIQEGIQVLEVNDEARTAFRLANAAMATSARRGNPGRYAEGQRPTWRLFQLGFLLLNIPGLVHPGHKDRDRVELIFFPTGGGKSEAYLGVIAFTLLLRRMRGAKRADGGLGVAVLLRYTLRLLTLDQLARAATLVCALEQLRQNRMDLLGEVRFAIGLWVGRTATANTLAEVAEKILTYKAAQSSNAPSPFPLADCPWCQTALTRDSLDPRPSKTNIQEVVVGCVNPNCEFSASRNEEGLPILFVDEQVYRELPAFLISTVDKFAMLPWRGETAMLFGRVSGRTEKQFFGALHQQAGQVSLPEGVPAPELIVQDELHLISGPLGTMVGLYESAIEGLCRGAGGDTLGPRPKILASTATVRRAAEQCRALFGREDVRLFPPPGTDALDTWFADVDDAADGRLYVGLAASGWPLRKLLVRTYDTLLAGAAHSYEAAGDAKHVADAYMTLVGYFNSLRELGGMRRLVEDEVRVRVAMGEKRRPLDFEGQHPWSRDRRIQVEPTELTSREPTNRVAETRRRLRLPHSMKEHVDVLLASNMISVGIDVDRLGLMAVAGQPKTTSEYIQATSRVGRQADRPGLVVTCFNVYRPRDRSHYERFSAYHESFYRWVETSSLTPFSGPALDRGLAGTLVALTRLSHRIMTPPLGAMAIQSPERRAVAEKMADLLSGRAALQHRDEKSQERAGNEVMDRCRNLLDAWDSLVKSAREGAGNRTYSRFDRQRPDGRPLLFMSVDEGRPPDGTDDAKFCAPTSMRDVESSAHLWLQRGTLGGRV